MMFARLSAIGLLVSASAALGHSMALVEVDNTTGNADSFYPGFDDAGWRTFDLVVTVDPGDDWLATSAHPAGVVQPGEVVFGNYHGQGSVTDGLFFQHTLGGNEEPNSALFSLYPALEFDSFFANPPALFDGESASFAAGPDWTDQSVYAVWFDTPDYGDGTFSIARFTFTGDLWVEGYTQFRTSGGDLFGYSLTTVPAPANLALMGLAGLIRRR
ncbi:MAG: hypothetical protein ACF8NJ_02560 [Phycisphaerales bacterium JB038]